LDERKTHKIDDFHEIISNKENRKLASRRDRRSVWHGLGIFGMVGWSVAVPTVLGIALGIWLDKNYERDFSWTLSLMVAGLMAGCVLAWKWINKENKDIYRKNEDR